MKDYVVFMGNENKETLIFVKSITAIRKYDDATTQIYTNSHHIFAVRHSYEDVLNMISIE